MLTHFDPHSIGDALRIVNEDPSQVCRVKIFVSFLTSILQSQSPVPDILCSS